MSEPETGLPGRRLVLLDQVSGGDKAARERLLERHRAGLRSLCRVAARPPVCGRAWTPLGRGAGRPTGGGCWRLPDYIASPAADAVPVVAAGDEGRHPD